MTPVTPALPPPSEVPDSPFDKVPAPEGEWQTFAAVGTSRGYMRPSLDAARTQGTARDRVIHFAVVNAAPSLFNSRDNDDCKDSKHTKDDQARPLVLINERLKGSIISATRHGVLVARHKGAKCSCGRKVTEHYKTSEEYRRLYGLCIALSEHLQKLNAASYTDGQHGREPSPLRHNQQGNPISESASASKSLDDQHPGHEEATSNKGTSVIAFLDNLRYANMGADRNGSLDIRIGGADPNRKKIKASQILSVVYYDVTRKHFDFFGARDRSIANRIVYPGWYYGDGAYPCPSRPSSGTPTKAEPIFSLATWMTALGTGSQDAMCASLWSGAAVDTSAVDVPWPERRGRPPNDDVSFSTPDVMWILRTRRTSTGQWFFTYRFDQGFSNLWRIKKQRRAAIECPLPLPPTDDQGRVAVYTRSAWVDVLGFPRNEAIVRWDTSKAAKQATSVDLLKQEVTEALSVLTQMAYTASGQAIPDVKASNPNKVTKETPAKMPADKDKVTDTDTAPKPRVSGESQETKVGRASLKSKSSKNFDDEKHTHAQEKLGGKACGEQKKAKKRRLVKLRAVLRSAFCMAAKAGGKAHGAEMHEKQ